MRQKSCANQEDSWTYIHNGVHRTLRLWPQGCATCIYTRISIHAYLKHRSFLQDRVKVRWCWLKFVGTSMVAGEREAEEKEREKRGGVAHRLLIWMWCWTYRRRIWTGRTSSPRRCLLSGAAWKEGRTPSWAPPADGLRPNSPSSLRLHCSISIRHSLWTHRDPAPNYPWRHYACAHR